MRVSRWIAAALLNTPTDTARMAVMRALFQEDVTGQETQPEESTVITGRHSPMFEHWWEWPLSFCWLAALAFHSHFSCWWHASHYRLLYIIVSHEFDNSFIAFLLYIGLRLLLLRHATPACIFLRAALLACRFISALFISLSRFWIAGISDGHFTLIRLPFLLLLATCIQIRHATTDYHFHFRLPQISQSF